VVQRHVQDVEVAQARLARDAAGLAVEQQRRVRLVPITTFFFETTTTSPSRSGGSSKRAQASKATVPVAPATAARAFATLRALATLASRLP